MVHQVHVQVTSVHASVPERCHGAVETLYYRTLEDWQFCDLTHMRQMYEACSIVSRLETCSIVSRLETSNCLIILVTRLAKTFDHILSSTISESISR